jgi:hypothetical protein
MTMLMERRRVAVDPVREILRGIGVEFYDGASHECSQHEYEEWPGQWQVIASPKRFILMAGGEQTGKSWDAAGKVVHDYLSQGEIGRNRKPRLYWLVGWSYQETQKEFDYLAEWFDLLGLRVSASKKVDPGEIRLVDGTRIVTKSAQDIRTLSKEAPDGIVGCEASQLDMTIFERLRSRATPKKAWIFLAGTFETGDGWYQALYTSWEHGHDDRTVSASPHGPIRFCIPAVGTTRRY